MSLTIADVYGEAATNAYYGRIAIHLNWKTISLIISYWLRYRKPGMDPFDGWCDSNADAFAINASNVQNSHNIIDISITNVADIIFKIITKYIRSNDKDDFYVIMNNQSNVSHLEIQCLPLTSTQLKHEIKKSKQNSIILQHEHEIKREFQHIQSQKESRVLFDSTKICKSMFELQYDQQLREHRSALNPQIASVNQFRFRLNVDQMIIPPLKICVMNNLPYASLTTMLFPLQFENSYEDSSIIEDMRNTQTYPELKQWQDSVLTLKRDSSIFRPRYVTGILFGYKESLALYIKETQEIYAIPNIFTQPHDFHLITEPYNSSVYSEYLRSAIFLSNDLHTTLINFNWNNCTLHIKKNLFPATSMDVTCAASLLDNERYCKYTENCILFVKDIFGRRIKHIDLTSLGEEKRNIFDDNFDDQFSTILEWNVFKQELMWKHYHSSNILIDGYYGQSMIICGGESKELFVNESCFEKTRIKNHCEIFNLEKPNLGWKSLPFLNRDHGKQPYICLDPDNPNTLCCIGGNEKGTQDEFGQVIEKLDLRECNKWRLVDVVRYPQNKFGDGQYVARFFG